MNVAGISRPTGFATGVEDDWRAVLSVHVDGYLTVLRAALPIMAAAGRGRILGVTSGSGWRAADAGAYSCAKRAVAALTWRMGQEAPAGVTVNALSPIAATRMVLGALQRQAGAGNTTGRDAATGGVSLGAVPPPEHLGPVGAYLGGESFSEWCHGQIMFSNGAEIAWVVPPRFLEMARTADVKSLPQLFDALGPAVFGPAEAVQATNGGGNPRVGAAFDEAAPEAPAARAARCVIVTDDRSWGHAVSDALGVAGVECVGVGTWQSAVPGPAQPATGFEAIAEQLAGVAANAGPVDAVVVALGTGVDRVAGNAPGWQRVLDEHAGITDRIRNDAAWMRAVSDLAAATDTRVRVVTLVDATTAGGTTRAHAATQLARAAHGATADRVDAFVIGVEAAPEATPRPSPSSPPTSCAALTPPRSPARSSSPTPSGSGCVATRARPERSRSVAPTSPAGSTTRSGTWSPALHPGRENEEARCPLRSNASSTRTFICGTRRALTGTPTWPVSGSSTWATCRACAVSSISPPTSRSRRTGTS